MLPEAGGSGSSWTVCALGLGFQESRLDGAIGLGEEETCSGQFVSLYTRALGDCRGLTEQSWARADPSRGPLAIRCPLVVLGAPSQG